MFSFYLSLLTGKQWKYGKTEEKGKYTLVLEIISQFVTLVLIQITDYDSFRVAEHSFLVPMLHLSLLLSCLFSSSQAALFFVVVVVVAVVVLFCFFVLFFFFFLTQTSECEAEAEIH